MEWLTRASNHFLSRLGQGAIGYVGVNLLLLAAEARWHLIYRLMLWDISEMKTLGFLVGQTVQVTQQVQTLHHLHP
ncbi:MAG: hypothetical protein WBD57_10670 [Candidatus Cybelea sp.]